MHSVKFRAIGLMVSLLVVLSSARTVHAGFFSFKTPAGSQITLQPVSAQADFTTANGTITIDIFNLLANPKSVAQTISGIEFTTTNPVISGASISDSWGNLIDIQKDGSVKSLGKEQPLGRWHVSTPATTLIALGGGQPDHLIIGPADKSGKYSNGGGSITGGQFNPFVDQTAHFLLSAAGVTDLTQIAAVKFYFGTGPDGNITGTPTGGPGPLDVPAPASAVLLVLGAGGLGWFMPRARRKR